MKKQVIRVKLRGNTILKVDAKTSSSKAVATDDNGGTITIKGKSK